MAQTRFEVHATTTASEGIVFIASNLPAANTAADMFRGLGHRFVHIVEIQSDQQAGEIPGEQVPHG